MVKIKLIMKKLFKKLKRTGKLKKNILYNRKTY